MLTVTRLRAILVVATSLFLLFAARPAMALSAMQLNLGDAHGAGWSVHGMRLSVRLTRQGATQAQLSAAAITLPAPVGKLTDVSIRCPQLRLRDTDIECDHASAQLPTLEQAPVQLSFRYDLRTRHLRLQAGNVAVAGGTIDINAELQAGRWRIQADARALAASQVPKLLAAAATLPAGYRYSGRLAARLAASGRGAEIDKVDADLRATKLGFSSSDGANAGQNLDFSARVRLRIETDTWKIDGNAEAENGIVCVPTCWQLPSQPLAVNWSGRWSPGSHLLELAQLDAKQADSLDMRARLRLQWGQPTRLVSAHVDLRHAALDRVYATYLKPLLLDTRFGDLIASGDIGGQFDYQSSGAATANLRLSKVGIDDRKGRFGIRDADGQLHWNSSSGAPAPNSTLRWRGGHIYKLTLGPAALRLQLHQRRIDLLQPADLGVLDGSLQIARLHISRIGRADMDVLFDGLLTPVSMRLFSQAMGWPALAGKLSGVIPDVSYRGGTLRVGGVLLVRAFEGDITIRHLQLQRLFQVAPSLRADIRLRQLDLDALTRTFSFGTIEGRLNGVINGLHLLDWQPVAFDARLATPTNDTSRHRISQRAVNNLTSLGGGMGGALSRSFLRIFDEFSYTRLGITCRLENGVCHMGGVAPAPNGYYIVEAGGLPRINVIGYARNVDWNTLLERLKAVTRGDAVIR